MESVSVFLSKKTLENKEVPFRNRRDEIVSKITKAINDSRIGTKFKPVTEKMIALKINQNPFLSKKDNDGELELLYSDCLKKGSFSKFWWILKQK